MNHYSWLPLLPLSIRAPITSIGSGNTIVEFLSAAMVDRVWRYLDRMFFNELKTTFLKMLYLSCRAAGEALITSEASFRALEACCSP